MNVYTTIAQGKEVLFKDKGSKFVGEAHFVETKEQVDEVVNELRKQHPKSRHVCYAYIMDEEKGLFRANDDGEPSNSAGIPILNQIRSANLRYTLVTVVRYFGGTLLGVPGLINAYKTVAKWALDDAALREDYEKAELVLKFGYDQMEAAMSRIKSENLPILDSEYAEFCTLTIQVPNDEEYLHVSYFGEHGIKTSQ